MKAMDEKRALSNLPSGRLRPSWLLLLSFLMVPFSYSLAQDMRADLPANNSLRVENRRGDVRVEVWNEPHVSVTAVFVGETPQSSPVIIRRTEQLLNVLVASGATGPASSLRVNLSLHVPARTRVEILTNGGGVEVLGIPAALTAQTQSGNIKFIFSDPAAGLNISAKASVGKISVVTPDLVRKGVPAFESVRGKDGKPVRLSSERGRISLLGGVDTRAPGPPSAEERTPPPLEQKPPTLGGTTDEQQSVAGTPAAPLTAPEEIDEGDVIRVDTELVTLNVSVVDRATSRGLLGLAQSDFKIFEDGAEQPITHFESASAPFNLVLVIDLSGSTKDKLKLIRDAALRFVDAARPEDSIAVITFAGTAVLVSPLTTDREALHRRINAIESAQGDTKLYDALNFAMTDALKDVGTSRRTAIVVMSDGLDGTLPSVHGDGSRLSYNEILSQIREFDGVVYSLWVDTEYESLSEQDTQPEDFDAGHDRMAELAEAGGGLFYEVDKLEDLAGAYERVVADIGTVYSLSYHPSNNVRDGKWRAIRVRVTRPNAVARGKSGYYAK
ncbi:MAG: VWA domain-containing protein [Acidobacteria bacterium]|nr:VWA domain-containing protein [Acidobacteriota bacterium]